MISTRRAKHLLVILLGLPLALGQLSRAVGLEPQNKALEFSERVVAGGPSDFMTVRHMRLRGSQRAIGKKLAEIVQTRHGGKPARTGAARSLKRAAYYQSTFPMQHQRALGAADFFGETDDSKRDTSVLPYNMPKRFGCSVVYYPPSHSASQHATLSRNYDWSTGTWGDLLGPDAAKDDRATTEDPYVMEIYPDSGYASLFLTAYELMGSALDGVNSEGLTVAILTNSRMPGESTPSNGWRVGLSEIEIVRFLLETCADVEEARKALRSIETYYMFVPCHFIIGDRAGNSFVWEYSFDLKERYTIDGKNGPQWVTNHSLHGFPSVDSIPTDLLGRSTFKRFKRLDTEIGKASGRVTVDTMKRANSCVASGAMNPGGSGRVLSRTLWHAIYDCQDSSLDIDFYLGEKANGPGERRSGYVHFQLEN